MKTTCYNAIQHKIETLWNKENTIDRTLKQLYLHGIKESQLISPFQYHTLQESLDDKDLFNQRVRLLVDQLSDDKKIDRRSSIQLNKLIRNNKIDDALSYLTAISLVNSLSTEKNRKTLSELATPEIQKQLNHVLENYQDSFTFSKEDISKIQSLSAKVACYNWASRIEDEDLRKDLIKTIVEENHQKFVLCITDFLQTESRKDKFAANPLQKQMLLDVVDSMKLPSEENCYIQFSQTMQSQDTLLSIIDELKKVEKVVQEANPMHIDKTVVEDLRNFHQNMGLTVGNNAQFAGSATLYSLMLGRLRNSWQSIENKLLAIDSNYHIIPTAHEKDSWPDIGLREIKPEKLKFEQETVAQTVPQKKIFFAYCSWGAGHRSTTDALQKYAGNKFRTVTCDLPDEVFLERDPLFNTFGEGHSTTTLYNTLIAGNFWGVLKFIRKLGGSTSVQEHEIQKMLIRRKIVQEQPDIIVSAYEKHNKVLYELSQELGIPFMHIATDMVSKFTTLEDLTDISHLQVLVPYELPKMREELPEAIKGLTKAVGFPVRKEFIGEVDEKAIKEKLNIPEDKKVILCVNGGCGSPVPWPELISKAKTGTLGKCHVIVICGRNEDNFKQLKKLRSIDPNITFDIRGFTGGEEMAQFSAIADICITKPGGVTTAEMVSKKTFMLLEAPPKDTPLTWEKDTADILIETGLAMPIHLKDPSTFLDTLKKGLATTYTENQAFHGQKETPLENFVNAVNEGISLAEKDEGFINRRNIAYESTLPYKNNESREPSSSHFEQNLASILHFRNQFYPEEILRELTRCINRGPFIKYDENIGSFEASEQFNLESFKYGVQVMQRHLATKKPVEVATLETLIHMIDQKKDTDPELSKALAYIDQSRISLILKDKSLPRDLKSVLEELVIEKAKNQLKAWVNLQTSKNRRKGSTDCMMSEANAIRIFIEHPDQYEFIQKLHLHRKASAYNHVFQFNENNEICIKVDGKETPVKDLINRFHYVNNRFICTDKPEQSENYEYTYTWDKGLTPITKEKNPIEWGDDIPVFKQKDRKSKDYRLEIMTTTEQKENHGWVRLKTPEGQVYSIGRSWDKDYQLAPLFQRATTIPGVVMGGGDIQEFLGCEKDWKRTKIILNKETFEALKDRIIQIHKTDKAYNLLNHNCSSLVEEILKEIASPLSQSQAPSVLLLPKSKLMKKFLIKHSNITLGARALLYPLALISNFFQFLVGIGNKQDVDPKSKAGFKSGVDIINIGNGLIDDPRQLRLVQEVIQEEANKDSAANNEPPTSKIIWEQYLKARGVNNVGQNCLRTTLGTVQ